MLSTFHVALLESLKSFLWLLLYVVKISGLAVSQCRSSLWTVSWPIVGRHIGLQPYSLQWKLSSGTSCCFRGGCMSSAQQNVCQENSDGCIHPVGILLSITRNKVRLKREQLSVSSSSRWGNQTCCSEVT